MGKGAPEETKINLKGAVKVEDKLAAKVSNYIRKRGRKGASLVLERKRDHESHVVVGGRGAPLL